MERTDAGSGARDAPRSDRARRRYALARQDGRAPQTLKFGAAIQRKSPKIHYASLLFLLQVCLQASQFEQGSRLG
jgi:hypothetical protein